MCWVESSRTKVEIIQSSKSTIKNTQGEKVV